MGIIKKTFEKGKEYIVYACIIIIGSIYLVLSSSPQLECVYGDMAVFMAQAYSFAYDYDNVFDENDFTRFCEEINESGPNGIFLNEANHTYFFSKPLLYGFLSAPFVRLFGIKGFLVFNWICLVSTIFLLYKYLRQKNKIFSSMFFVIGLFVVSLALPYVFNIYSDLLVCLILSFVLFFYDKYSVEESRNELYFVLSAIALGIMIYQRPPFVFFAFFIFIKMVLKKNYKEAFKYTVIALIPFVLFSFVHNLQIGTYTPYNGIRYYGFVKSVDSVVTFDELQLTALTGSKDSAIVSDIISNIKNPKTLLLNIFYYFFGRQTGILIYCPFIISILSIKSVKTIIKSRWEISLAILCVVFFFFLQAPFNYYGGGQSFGNRYFLQILPAFVFLVDELSLKKQAVTSVIATIFAGIFLLPALLSPKQLVWQCMDFQDSEIMLSVPREYTIFSSVLGMHSDAVKIVTGDYQILLEGTYPKETENGFWTVGGGKSEICIRSSKKINGMEVEISVPKSNVIDFSGEEIVIDGGEQIVYDVDCSRYTEIDGKYFYTFDISTEGGYIPKYGEGSSDTRNLGAFIQIRNINLE